MLVPPDASRRDERLHLPVSHRFNQANQPTEIRFFTEVIAAIVMAVAVSQAAPASAAGTLDDIGLVKD